MKNESGQPTTMAQLRSAGADLMTCLKAAWDEIDELRALKASADAKIADLAKDLAITQMERDQEAKDALRWQMTAHALGKPNEE